MGLYIHCVFLCGYSYIGASITGRAAKLVCPLLDSSVKEESFDQACSRTGEMSWRVIACDGEFTLDPLFAVSCENR